MSSPSCLLGTICVIVVAFQFLRNVLPWLYQNLIGPSLLGPKVDVRKMGDWAVITGATEGIGKAYAKALAKKGLNLILISRSAEKLENVSKEIGETSKVQIKVIVVDFKQGQEIYERIEKHILGLEVGVLVNNVGISYECPEYFLSIPNRDTFLQDIIACNIHSVTHMCKIVMPGMVERKRGVVINISSLAAVIPNPMLCVYSATKAFVDKFSEDLNTEYKEQGIVVQSVLPGFVATNMSKIKKATWLAPTPDKYVDSALKTLGISRHTTGYFPHSLLKLTLDLVKYLSCTAVANQIVFTQLKNIRNRAHRRSKNTN